MWRQLKRRRHLAWILLLPIVLFCALLRRSDVRPHQAVIKPVAVRQLPATIELGPPGIVLHNSDTPGRINGKLVDEKWLDRLHSEEHASWKTVCDGKTYHIGYHYVILADGTVQQGRPEDCLGAHARTHNDWLGICVVGGFSTNRHWWPEYPTARQMRSLIALCEHLMSKYHIPPRYIKRHRDLNNTWCPGDRFPYHRLMTILEQYAAAHPETQPLAPRIVSLAIPKRHQHRIYSADTWLSPHH